MSESDFRPSTSDLCITLTEEQRLKLHERVDPNVLRAYNEFIQHKQSGARRWLTLYRLALLAAEVNVAQRWRTSELALLLRYDGIETPGTYAIAYSHCVTALLVERGFCVNDEHLPIV
jgi:hypothetical protein